MAEREQPDFTLSETLQGIYGARAKKVLCTEPHGVFQTPAIYLAVVYSDTSGAAVYSYTGFPHLYSRAEFDKRFEVLP